MKTRFLLMLFLLTPWLVSCQPPATPTAPATTSANHAETHFQPYFTNPSNDTLRGGPDAAVAKAIDAARVSVDAALYDLNLWSIRDALLRAHRRGVQVRIVAESDHLDRPEFQELIKAGIPVVGDGRKALMHDKFIVIDRYEVWTGSMNFTLNGAYRNNNNLVRMISRQLAEDYTTEFEEMFLQHQFGADSPANTPYPQTTLDGVSVAVYFAPEDHPLTHLTPVLERAQKSIYFMAFNLTNDNLARLLIAKAQQGVKVQGVFDERQAKTSTGNDYLQLKKAGLPVFLDANPYAMHHKVFIIDDQIVVFGSYNFTHSAETRNDENLVIVHDPLLAAQFLEEFHRVYNAATEYNR